MHVACPDRPVTGMVIDASWDGHAPSRGFLTEGKEPRPKWAGVVFLCCALLGLAIAGIEKFAGSGGANNVVAVCWVLISCLLIASAIRLFRR